jgi:Rab9 effector protein with kelch motifs
MWTKLVDEKIDPNVVTCRSGHSTTAVGKKLLIFGGGSTNETTSLFLNDILIFDTESLRWQMAYSSGPTPAGRTKHTATLIGSKLYVFGGGDGLRLFNDIFCLDIGMFKKLSSL